MKYIIAILLIVTIAIQTFSKWIVIAAYEINKDYIAKNLCVNRTRPSCCKGKCFLQKRLAADEEQQQPAGKSAHQDIQVELFLQPLVQIDFRLQALSRQHNFLYLNGKSQEFASSFFQPPKC